MSEKSNSDKAFFSRCPVCGLRTMSSPLLHEDRCLCMPDNAKSSPRKKNKEASWRVKSPFKLVHATDPKILAAPGIREEEGEKPKVPTIPLIAPALNAVRDSDGEVEPAPKPIRVSQELLDGFNLIEKLGEGGMGTVFRARDRVLNREMAIKVMRADLVEDRAAIKRFQKEAAAAGDLTHPNIAQVYKCSIDETAPYMVMEYVDGVSLSQILKHERRLSLKRVINLALQICDALQYAHDKGVIHRDLKPSNIIVVEGSHSELIKVVDFGIAKLAPTNETATGLTQSGEVFGTPEYMCPEQAKGITVDQRSDLYALGCILFEALTGRKLFSGDNAIQILLHHINTPITDRLELLRTKRFPESIIDLVAKLLAKQPEKRYQSANELAADLHRFQAGRLSSWRMRNNKKTMMAVYVAAIVTVLGSILWIWQFSLLSSDPLSLASRESPVPSPAPEFQQRVWTILPPSKFDETPESLFQWLKQCDERLDEPDANGSSELRDARLYAQMRLYAMVNPSAEVPKQFMDTLMSHISDLSPSAFEVACSTLVTLGDNSVEPLLARLDLHRGEKVCEDMLWSIGPPAIDKIFSYVCSDKPHYCEFGGWLIADLYTGTRFKDRLLGTTRTKQDTVWYDSGESMAITALGSVTEPGTRQRLLLALAQRDTVDQDTLVTILDILHNDVNPGVRSMAALSAAKLAGSLSPLQLGRTFEALKTAVLSDESATVRKDCADAIAWFIPVGLRDQVRASLIKETHDRSSTVRAQAREALRELDAPVKADRRFPDVMPSHLVTGPTPVN